MKKLIILFTVAFATLSILPKACASAVLTRELYCTATAYTSAEDECGRPASDPDYGRTASGEFVRGGFVAVDPKVIPLHSVLLIIGEGVYGIFEAKDTGGAIKGNIIDIYVPDKETAFKFGRRLVKIYVLREGEFMPFNRHFYAKEGFSVSLPERKTQFSAGYDFSLAEEVKIEPHTVLMAHTGIGVHMDWEDVLFIAPRSSLCKKGLMLANNVAVIDADYEGEIMLPLFNFTDEVVTVEKGERVAQGIFLNYKTTGDFVTAKRNGGFGSTN